MPEKFSLIKNQTLVTDWADTEILFLYCRREIYLQKKPIRSYLIITHMLDSVKCKNFNFFLPLTPAFQLIKKNLMFQTEQSEKKIIRWIYDSHANVNNL